MLKEVLNKLVIGEDLTEREAYETMNEIMQGLATPAQIASFLTALRIKKETVEEITGCAQSMRENAVKLKKNYPLALDTCGTGGDDKGTFNVSTVTAFIVAASGISVAKHGNRGVSSKSGSADVLEALGVNIQLTPLQVEACLEELGIAFFFAPLFHPAMKYAIGPRREINFRTIFNLLGPLTNPAGVKRQILGVYDFNMTELIAGVLERLGTKDAMIVCGEDGLDEISITGLTKITQIKDRKMKTYSIEPEDLGFERYRLEDITGGNAQINAEISLDILKGKRGPQRLMVILNSAAAFVVGKIAKDLQDGVKMATEIIDSGQALKKLEALKEYTQELI